MYSGNPEHSIYKYFGLFTHDGTHACLFYWLSVIVDVGGAAGLRHDYVGAAVGDVIIAGTA